jgi:glycosyltransferase involved in cell wall biosynthesis
LRQRKVVWLQPYVPVYRGPLFEKVRAHLALSDVDLIVAYGRGARLRADLNRGDAIDPEWAQPLDDFTWKTPFGAFYYRSLSGRARDADLLVAELDAGNLNAWAALRPGAAPLVLFGHGKSYTSAPNVVADLLEVPLIRRARRVLTYMPSGRDAVLARSKVDPSRVTAFMNSSDTTAIMRQMDQVTDDEAAQYLRALGRQPSETLALYLGGLDKSKRIDLLLEACVEASRVDPSFHLVVAGSGEALPLFEPYIADGLVTHVGYADAHAKAVLARLCRLIVMPGRVGLVAVDSVAMGLRLLTTRYPWHAPEIEYLVEGHNLFVVEEEVSALSKAMLELASQPPLDPPADPPSIEAAAERIAGVLMAALDHGRS